MEGLAEIISAPGFFLFHDEDGRWQTPEERAFYLKRITAIHRVANNLAGKELKGKP
jgi:hypothetical protein